MEHAEHKFQRRAPEGSWDTSFRNHSHDDADEPSDTDIWTKVLPNLCSWRSNTSDMYSGV